MPLLTRQDKGTLLLNDEVDENFLSSVIDKGDLPAATDWNTLVRPQMRRVNYVDWTGASNHPASAGSAGLLHVYQSGNAVVQRYTQTGTGSVDWIRTKTGVSDWTAWTRSANSSVQDFLLQNAGIY